MKSIKFENMKLPEYLKPGDKVGIVCTARSFSEEEAQPAIELLTSWGLQAVLGATIGLNTHQLGGADVERANDLQTMLDSPEIKAIWVARGGYGTVRIIDKIKISTNLVIFFCLSINLSKVLKSKVQDFNTL